MSEKVDIIIPTLHRCNSLVRLLRSLAIEKQFICNVIIVEQLENNKAQLQKLAKELKISILYKTLDYESTSHAKNIGITQTTSSIVLFLDDDVVATKGFIAHHLKNFQDPKVAAVCGRSIAEGFAIEPDRHDVGRISTLAQFSDGYTSTIRQEIDTVIGCNAMWKKDVLNELHGFDEQFTGNAMREESDLSLRAKKLGYKIIFEPKALVYHMREPTGGARKGDNRFYWYFHFFSNELYFFLKHMNKIFLPLFFATRSAWMLKCMFGFGREVSLRSISTPFSGYYDGFKKYFIYENRG